MAERHHCRFNVTHIKQSPTDPVQFTFIPSPWTSPAKGETFDCGSRANSSAIGRKNEEETKDHAEFQRRRLDHEHGRAGAQ